LLQDHLIRGRQRRNSTSHRGSAREKTFLGDLRESRSEVGKSATSSAPREDYLLQAKRRRSVYLENPVVHLPYGKMYAGHKEKGNKQGESPSSCCSTFALKGE
jgi:hypothetical protein